MSENVKTNQDTGTASNPLNPEGYDFQSLQKEIAGLLAEVKKSRLELQRLREETEDLFASSSSMLKTVPQIPVSKSSASQLKMAAIMDEFTFQCYAPECHLLQLTPDAWQNEMNEFKPDLLFIETAWQGKDSLWNKKISGCDATLRELIKYCHEKKIPVVFWSKEDPPHYSVFLPVARLADVVFTTDVDCVPYYKRDLGHNRVYLLPFAAQPALHNPLEKYDRKQSFCFAGSWYCRYPKRQKDFRALMEALKMENAEIEIYDRMAGKNDPSACFPAEFKPFIKGVLPYAEIDKAYKGYAFGINMNTVKNSQSMFARRVYELAASNTVVVSNYSRGLSNLFGDLVIASDNAGELSRRLRPVLADKTAYRKLRLAALRHVFASHTYAHRLEYIRSKIWNKTLDPDPLIAIYAKVENETDADIVISQFNSQLWKNKKLYICAPQSLEKFIQEKGGACRQDEEHCRAEMAKAGAALIGVMSSKNFYGPHYLTDLALASRYAPYKCFGKAARYIYKNDNLKLANDGSQYKSVEGLSVDSTLCKSEYAYEFWDALKNSQYLDGLALDEFNFIENGTGADEELRDTVLDMPIADMGINLQERLLPFAEKIELINLPNVYTDELVIFNAEKMADEFKSVDDVNIKLEDKNLKIVSVLEENKNTYIRGNLFRLKDLNLDKNNTVCFYINGSLDVRLLVDMRDAQKNKIKYHLLKPGKYTLVIPKECKLLQLGLRVEGPGSAELEQLVFGGDFGMPPVALPVRSSCMVVAKQYPAYNDLYRYGFLHSRVREYHKHGLSVDMFRVRKENPSFWEFEGINVATGDLALLDSTLATGQTKHVCVHMIDKDIWNVVKKHLDHLCVTIWIHGAEMQHWRRREFEFALMDDEEIKKTKRRTASYMNLWKEILSVEHQSLKFVIVSDKFKEDCEEDVGMKFPKDSCHTIHNFIDGKIFPYTPKTPEKRFSIVSIRPFSALKYANDLTVAAIQELHNRPGFYRYKFTIAGDGPLFDDTVRPIADYPNVKLIKKFLNHQQMCEEYEKHGVVLLPTRCDAQGVSRDEAMSCGLVPVTSNVMAIPEFINDSCGFMAPLDDHIGLADAIEKLASDADLFMELSKNAAEHVRKISGFDETILKEIKIFK